MPRIEVYIPTDEEKKTIQAEAIKAGLTVSQYMRLRPKELHKSKEAGK